MSSTTQHCLSMALAHKRKRLRMHKCVLAVKPLSCLLRRPCFLAHKQKHEALLPVCRCL